MLMTEALKSVVSRRMLGKVVEEVAQGWIVWALENHSRESGW